MLLGTALPLTVICLVISIPPPVAYLSSSLTALPPAPFAASAATLS